MPRFIAALALVAGCAPVRNYVYGPTPTTGPANADGRIEGHAATRYLVPPDDPRGDVELAVQRLTRVGAPEGRFKKNVRVVVVRMIVHNRDNQLWCVDSGSIDAIIGGSQHEYPIRAYSDGQPQWVMVLRPGEKRWIDLYYAIPENDGRPSIAINWRVQTPSGVITRATTSLARREAPPPPTAPPAPSNPPGLATDGGAGNNRIRYGDQ